MLLVYITYLISIVSYQCLKRIVLHFKTGTFSSPAPPNERLGVLAPSPPSPVSLFFLDYLEPKLVNLALFPLYAFQVEFLQRPFPLVSMQEYCTKTICLAYYVSYVKAMLPGILQVKKILPNTHFSV